MLKSIRKKLNPSCYQGNNNSRHFEGWYFKIVDKDQQNLYAIIPGVFIDKNKNDSHSFIQIFDGTNNKTYYNRFPLEDFQSKKYNFNIQINSNSFSSNKMCLDLNSSPLKINGELNFDNLVLWPKTLISPGIMGWYTWVPFMQCYHGIVSLNHSIQGSLTINNQNIDFSNGKGYTEKDWGKSFPEAWIWCQSNHFSTDNACITGSIAIIPWISKPFLGFIFGLWYKNKLYRFTTYNGAKLIHLKVEENKIKSVFEKKNLTLEIIINRSSGGFLQAPTINGMTHQISETMKSTVEITLSQKSNNKSETLFKDTGLYAGFEIAGDVKRLVQMYKKLKS
jgi:tocopherol cyclase